VVFDYGTDANSKVYRRPLGLLAKAILKAARESQTFWISSEPPVKKNLAALLDAYGLTLREHLSYGRETKRKCSFGGLATAVVSDLSKKDALDGSTGMAELVSGPKVNV